ncbi:MAG: hypothetical protein KatS3mg031_0548 [Chitinophagales bacterium]|nr:MAG: hypothetical protein KatS3mg031_0548 [Chitinophagales bacterium]
MFKHLLFFVICCLPVVLWAQMGMTSLPAKITLEGKEYTLHKVKAGETLYSICKFYKVELAELVAVNRIGSGGYTLLSGDILIIPLYAQKASVLDVDEKVISETGYITHVVKPGETLFSISRSYNGVTPAMIKEKNGLSSDTLRVNQKLMIPQQLNVVALYKSAPVVEVTAGENPSERRLKESLQKQFAKEEAAKGGTEVVRGIATWIDNDEKENTTNLFALHKYLPIGTIVRIRNLMNNRELYVKVIGKLPDNDEYQNVIIKVSKAAARQLHVLDEKFLVELMVPQQG